MENTNMGKKRSMGRRKIEIKKIQKKSSLEVTFSKRRTGLFKKAGELCILCGVEAAVIVFSPGGRAFVFGHPSPDAVIDRFLHQDPNKYNSLALVPTASGQVHCHEPRQYLEALDRLEVKKERLGGGDRGFWWEAGIENMGLTELEQFGGALRELIKKAEMKLEDMTMTTTRTEMKMAASRPPSSAMMEYATAPYVDFRGHDLALTLD